MKFEDMKLSYGYSMQLQIVGAAGQTERFSCRLIGCLPEQTILVSVPKVAGKLVRFKPGQKVVTRLMVDNGIGIFASLVEAQTLDPYPILHIRYPDAVSFKGIRGATRVAIDQSVNIINLSSNGSKNNHVAEQGGIVDISITGARIELTSVMGEIGDRLQLNLDVNVAGLVRTLEMEAIIRSRFSSLAQEAKNSEKLNNVEKLSNTEKLTYGVQFIEPDDDRRLLLYAYVYAQIGSEDMLS
jgi:hypothetical protein